MTSYKVEIIKIKTGEIMATIGKGLSERQAEKREMTGLSRIDRKDYFVKMSEEK